MTEEEKIEQIQAATPEHLRMKARFFSVNGQILFPRPGEPGKFNCYLEGELFPSNLPDDQPFRRFVFEPPARNMNCTDGRPDRAAETEAHPAGQRE